MVSVYRLRLDISQFLIWQQHDISKLFRKHIIFFYKHSLGKISITLII